MLEVRAAEDRFEPILTDAALRMNGSFLDWNLVVRVQC